MRLDKKYKKEVIAQMKEKHGYKNDLAVPRIEKVVVNTGIGRLQGDEKMRHEIISDLAMICGQQPVLRQAKKDIAGFKIRKGSVVGIAVTLRGKRMYDFLDRLIHIAWPRSRDFRGLPQKSVDQSGNFTIGIKEQIIFPEISAESAKNIFGFEVCIKTTAKSRQEALDLFKLMGFPLQK